VLRIGVREYLAENPPHILVSAVLPRAVLQCLFFTLLGRVIGGQAGLELAFVGSLAAVQTLATAVAICDVPMLDKWSGTFGRLRAGAMHPASVFALRAVPHVLQAVAATVLSLAVVGPLVGVGELALRLLPLLPLYALMAVTGAAAGLAAAALAVGRRADVLAGNVLAYLVLLTGGVLVPPGRLAWVDALGSVLPIRHGLIAVHRLLDGGPWAGELLLEAAVGAGWAVLAVGLVSTQIARARRLGIDDFD
jgi:ABC-2 type transport system permease protein